MYDLCTHNSKYFSPISELQYSTVTECNSTKYMYTTYIQYTDFSLTKI